MNEKPDGNPAMPEAALELRSLVELQAGAIVSRTLAKHQTGTITAFAFDAEQGLSEHTAPFDAWLIGVEGDAEIRIEQVPFALRAGEILRLPAGRPHAVRALTPFKMLLVMIRS